MTFKEAMVKAMTSRGMFDTQANEVIANYIDKNKDEAMMDIWNNDVSGYPDNMQAIIWIGVKEYTAKWIETNLPQAWFRPMFQYSESELETMAN